jgi:diguanylate cyclase (GGDEF)-like protein
MTATPETAVEVSQEVLAALVDHFDVDISFLRHNDRQLRATKLVAEWPERASVPDPDPIGIVYFDDADPVFALAEHLKEPTVLRHGPDTDAYQRRIEAGTGVSRVSLACVPLMFGDITTGTLGFIKIGERDWSRAELDALTAIAALFAQLQARVIAEERLRYLANHDHLTGLYNRRAMLAHLEARLAAGQPGPVAALFVDLDRLKAVNDYLGHDAGDLFIREFAERLDADPVESSLVARFGGDEFVVILTAPMDLSSSESLAQRLHDRLRDRVTIDSEIITRTVSIGVAVGFPGRDTPSDLLRRADDAVREAKHAGGNTVVVFSTHMAQNRERRDDIELHLQGGIDNDDLVLHYLPEVDMRTGDIVAAEALVRWRHPTRGLLLPHSFLDVSESLNLAGDVGRWVLRTACADLASWRSRGVGHTAQLRLNVSPAQLVTDGFVTAVMNTIDEFGIDSESICLDISERVLARDVETARHVLAALKEAGVCIAIDDFGTGYSGLSLLKSLPIDTLKIDRGFVRELGTNAGDLAIVRAIIALAAAFDLHVVAEGVETEAAAVTLLWEGCHRAQGFLFSPPVSGDAMEVLLSKRLAAFHVPESSADN